MTPHELRTPWSFVSLKFESVPQMLRKSDCSLFVNMNMNWPVRGSWLSWSSGRCRCYQTDLLWHQQSSGDHEYKRDSARADLALSRLYQAVSQPIQCRINYTHISCKSHTEIYSDQFRHESKGIKSIFPFLTTTLAEFIILKVEIVVWR